MATDGGGYILALDLGTSGVKVALVSTEGRIVETTVEPYGLTFLPGGGVEQDPEDWWRAVVRGAHALFERGTVRRDDVIGIRAIVQWSRTVAAYGAVRQAMNSGIWMAL